MIEPKPITHGGTARGGKLCRCNECGIERYCTPQFDFYTRDDDLNGPLVCEACLLKNGFTTILHLGGNPNN